MAPHQARAPDEIEGFATRTDILPGDPLRLKISTTAPSYQIHAYRAGWYGRLLMREVWTSGVLAGHRQARATLYPPTYTVMTAWSPSEVVDTRGWPPGSHLLRLDAPTGGQRYLPVTVRSASTQGALVLVNAVFRHIRFEPGSLRDGADRANRLEVNYKRQFGDPYNGRNNPEVTVDWPEPPVPRPESTLTGTFYDCNPVQADLVVTNPGSWPWEG